MTDRDKAFIPGLYRLKRDVWYAYQGGLHGCNMVNIHKPLRLHYSVGTCLAVIAKVNKLNY